MQRPKLQVTSVTTRTVSGAAAREDVVVVEMMLRRDQATRAIPYHMVDPEVFNSIGDWWDQQADIEESADE